jgi:transcriptional regulator with XRE-family HTH domain
VIDLHSVTILRNRKRKDVSEVFAALRNKSGLALHEIERRTNGRLNHSFLSKLSSGKTANPRLDKLTELADFFGVSVGEMAGEVEPDGLTETRLWQLFWSYQQLEPTPRKVVDDHIGDLIAMIEALPKAKSA